MLYFLDASVCLDLLDTTRPSSKESVRWYLEHKDNDTLDFYFSGDFITRFYTILTERKIASEKAVRAIDTLASEITPFYIDHTDFLHAKLSFETKKFDQFEILLVLHSAIRCGCSHFLTYDTKLLAMKRFNQLDIERP